MGGSLSPWLVLALIGAVAILLVAGSLWLGKRALPNVGTEHNPTLATFLTIVGLVYGTLIGFTVVSSWQQFSSAQAVVAGEASSLTTMYGQTIAMPEPEQTQMRQLLRLYASAVAGPEWEKQASGGTSDSARNAIIGMYRIVGSQSPSVASSPINGAFLNQLSVLASDRTARMLDAKPRIPPLLWAGLIFGGVVIVGFTVFCASGAHSIMLFSPARSPSCSACCYALSSCSTIRMGRSAVSRPNRSRTPCRFSTQSTGGHSQDLAAG